MSAPHLPRDLLVDRLVVCASGSITVAHLPSYLVALRSFYARHVTVLLSAAAESMIRADVVGLYADEVVADSDPNLALTHVTLTDGAADLVCLPATAHLLATAAAGLAPTRIGGAILAFDGPVTFFPAMTETMWAKPAVRRNVECLRADGHVVVTPRVTPKFVPSEAGVRPGIAIPGVDEVVALLRRQREAQP